VPASHDPVQGNRDGHGRISQPIGNTPAAKVGNSCSQRESGGKYPEDLGHGELGKFISGWSFWDNVSDEAGAEQKKGRELSRSVNI
jgi:hypothetical protein